jgi:hypothetical protein
MKKRISFLFILSLIVSLSSQAQKPFTMGTKVKMEAPVYQAQIVMVKGKSIYILCPAKPFAGSRPSDCQMWVYDSKGVKVSDKKVVIADENNKPHRIEKLLTVAGKIVCIHSFYDKAEKKYILYQTFIGEDGDPEGLGKDILSIETKNAEPIAGIDYVFSQDSSKFMVLAYEETISGKKNILNLHCLVFNKEDMSFDHDYPYAIELPNKGTVRAHAAISNQGTIYVVADLQVKGKEDKVKQTINVYYKDNDEAIQTKEFPMNDMKYVTEFTLGFSRKEALIIAGYWSSKYNLDVMNGTFYYIYDVANNEFGVQQISDISDDAKATLMSTEKDKKMREAFHIVYPKLFFDASNNAYLYGHQYENSVAQFKADRDDKYFVNVTQKMDFKNTMVSMYNDSGVLKFEKSWASTAQTVIPLYTKLYVFADYKKEMKSCFIEGNIGQIKVAKTASPNNEPDNQMDPRLCFDAGEDKMIAIGHQPGGGANFYLNMVDLGATERKAKIEVEKKKKK